jgi:hypothetical protein
VGVEKYRMIGPFGSRQALAYGDRVGLREIMWG